MTTKNRYYRRAKIFEANFRQLLRLFCMDLTATDVAALCHLSVRSTNDIYQRLRVRMLELCLQDSPFGGEIQADESYFGPKRIRGFCGRGAGGKTIVFGLLKRGDRVFTQVVSDAKKATLQGIFRGKVDPNSVIPVILCSIGNDTKLSLVGCGSHHFPIPKKRQSSMITSLSSKFTQQPLRVKKPIILFCLSLGALLMLNQNIQAQTKQITMLPRPTLDGRWRVEAIDQRKLKRPITNFRAENFLGDLYLPIGTTFTLEVGAPWGTDEPSRMNLVFVVHAPIPKEVCPAKPFEIQSKNRLYHPLCGSDGRAVTESYPGDWEFLGGWIEIARFGKIDSKIKKVVVDEYFSELGFSANDVSFDYQNKSRISYMEFIPFNRDTLLIPLNYLETIGFDVRDPRQSYGPVLLIAKRIK